MKAYSLFTLFLLQMLFINQASASLLISPNRVVLEDRQRSASVIIINNGEDTASYRIETINYRQTEKGKYKKVDPKNESISGLFLASDMIRFSPRQVSLKPGQRQTVRLSLRKPANLADGEYRVHLGFTRLPSPEMLKANQAGESLKVYMLTSFTIPVQILNGQTSFSSKITQAQLIPVLPSSEEKKKQWQIQVDIEREGNSASVGILKVYWKPNKDTQYKKIRTLDNATIYREIHNRRFNLLLPEGTAKPGIYKITYETSKPFALKLLDEKVLTHPTLP